MSKGLALLGGSFNPLHAGHMRLALGVLDSLPDQLDQVELIPCANPPHKQEIGMLPFELRASMVEAACAAFPRLRVNRLEAKRSGYSYTWDTLCVYREQLPERALYFILGSEDFVQLPTWKRGLELPCLADLIIVPRDGMDVAAFRTTAQQFWPSAYEASPLSAGSCHIRLPEGGSLHYLPLPRLDISSTIIRQYWLQEKSIHFLVPDAVRLLLEKQRTTARPYWHDGEMF